MLSESDSNKRRINVKMKNNDVKRNFYDPTTLYHKKHLIVDVPAHNLNFIFSSILSSYSVPGLNQICHQYWQKIKIQICFRLGIPKFLMVPKMFVINVDQ